MPMTLLEASKRNSGDVVRQTIIETFASASDVVAALRWMDVPGGAYTYKQEGKLGAIAFRGINQAYAESTGIVTPQTEVLRIMGGDIDVDTALVKMNGPEIREQEETMKLKAMALYMAKTIIKGDSLASVLEFDGLQNRITGSQLIAVKASATDGGDPLSMIKLDEAIDAVDNASHLIMSKAMVRIITAAARDTTVGGFVGFTQDEFGRKVTTYNDLPILIADYDNFGVRILDFNELGSTGSTATAASIYVVNLNDGYLQGLQNGAPEIDDLGKVQDKPVWRTRFEWLAGLATMHPRCAARLYGISNASAIK